MRPDGTPRSSDEPVGAELARRQFALQAAGLDVQRGPWSLSSVIVDDLDLVSIALAKFEADAPPLVYGHRPLAFAVALKLMQADASERTQIVQATSPH